MTPEQRRAEPLTESELAKVRAQHHPIETMQAGFFRCNCDFETDGAFKDDPYEWPCDIARLLATLDAERMDHEETREALNTAREGTPDPRVERLEAALNELHHPVMELDYVSMPSRDVEVCASCETGDGFHVSWPCPTAALLRSPQERSGE